MGSVNCRECSLCIALLSTHAHFAEQGRTRRSIISCSYVYWSEGQCVCVCVCLCTAGLEMSCQIMYEKVLNVFFNLIFSIFCSI